MQGLDAALLSDATALASATCRRCRACASARRSTDSPSPRWWPTPACTASTRRATFSGALVAQDAARIACGRCRGARTTGARGLAGAASPRGRPRLRARPRAEGAARSHGVRLAWGQTLSRCSNAARGAASVQRRRDRAGRARSPRRWAACTGMGDPPRHQASQPASRRRRPVARVPRPRRRALGPRRAGRASPHAGTPSYMNPEQGQGAAPDAARRPLRARRHALPLAHRPPALRRDRGLPGGALPARPDVAPRGRPRCADLADHLVLKAIALDARARFETAEEMLLALEAWRLAPGGAPAATPLLRATRPRRGRSRWASRCSSTPC